VAARAGTFCWLIGESEEKGVADTRRAGSSEFTVWFVRNVSWVGLVSYMDSCADDMETWSGISATALISLVRAATYGAAYYPFMPAIAYHGCHQYAFSRLLLLRQGQRDSFVSAWCTIQRVSPS